MYSEREFCHRKQYLYTFPGIFIERCLKNLKGERKLQKKVQAKFYLFKNSNRNTRKNSEICSKLTIKTPQRNRWPRPDAFIVNFENILNLFLVILRLILNTYLSTGDS